MADNPETKAQLEKQLEDSSNDATTYDVEFEGNCMVITGTISIQYSEDDIAATKNILIVFHSKMQICRLT